MDSKKSPEPNNKPGFKNNPSLSGQGWCRRPVQEVR